MLLDKFQLRKGTMTGDYSRRIFSRISFHQTPGYIHWGQFLVLKIAKIYASED